MVTFAPTRTISNDGPVGSETSTWKLHWLLAPLALLAVQVTVVVPAGKLDPLAGAQLTVVSGQLSVNVGVKFTI